MAKDLYDEGHMKATEVLKRESAEQSDAYNKWKELVFKHSAFDEKTAELLALCAAVAVQCEYCIDTHRQKAKARGATEKEIASIVQIASAVRAGSGLSYGVEALREK